MGLTMMKAMTKAPPGAMTERELETVVPQTVIYKVWDENDAGDIDRAVVMGPACDGRAPTTDSQHTIYFETWFKKKRGNLFTNYFHAYAYSLKCKERNRGRGTV
jgi:hypothetical protein